MIGMWFGYGGLVIKQDGFVVLEESAAVPRLTFGPESKCSEKRWLADRGARVRDLAILQRTHGHFLGEVNQERAIRTEIAAFLVNSSVKPLTKLKDVTISVPLDQLNPPGWAPAKNYDRRGLPCDDHEEASREFALSNSWVCFLSYHHHQIRRPRLCPIPSYDASPTAALTPDALCIFISP